MSKGIYGFVLEKIAILDAETSHARALRAKLRRGVGKKPEETPEAWEVTLLGMQDDWYNHRLSEASRAELAIHTALTLYALHRQGKDSSVNDCGDGKDGVWGGNSFGAAAARLVEPNESNLYTIKRRFDAVATATDFTELAHHARGIIQLLKAHDNLTMNYPRFAEDLFYFQLPDYDGKVRLRWGEDFYRVFSNMKSDKEKGKDEKPNE